jgi:hypothetical protein
MDMATDGTPRIAPSTAAATGAGRDGVLVLRWTTGGETTLELSYDYERRRVYVDGDHMLQGQNEYCQ